MISGHACPSLLLPPPEKIWLIAVRLGSWRHSRRFHYCWIVKRSAWINPTCWVTNIFLQLLYPKAWLWHRSLILHFSIQILFLFPHQRRYGDEFAWWNNKKKMKTLYVSLKRGIEQFDCRQKRCKRRFKCLSQPVLNLWRNTCNHAGRLSLIRLPQFRPSSKCLLSPNICHFWFKGALQHLLSITHLNPPLSPPLPQLSVPIFHQDLEHGTYVASDKKKS